MCNTSVLPIVLCLIFLIITTSFLCSLLHTVCSFPLGVNGRKSAVIFSSCISAHHFLCMAYLVCVTKLLPESN